MWAIMSALMTSCNGSSDSDDSDSLSATDSSLDTGEDSQSAKESDSEKTTSTESTSEFTDTDDTGHFTDTATGTFTDSTSSDGSDVETDIDTNVDSDTVGEMEGALLGLYYGDDGIDQTSKKIGRQLPVHLTYYDFTHDWTGSVTRDDIANGRIPLVNWEVFNASLDDIINGEYDDMLANRAAAARKLNADFFLDFGAEMNGDWSPWGGAQNGKSADTYLAAYRHVHDAFDGVDNIIWLWCPNVTDEPGTDWNATMNYYPGDDYVDWTCVDGYNWGTAGGGGWQSFKDVFKNIYPKLAEKEKPIMIGEMASAEGGGDKASFIENIVPTLQNDFPLIKGLVWFDIDKETDWRISSSAESESAFIEMAAHPYMNPDIEGISLTDGW
jgi:beta-mannanase